jgi:Mg-chelatase subunit ChlD
MLTFINSIIQKFVIGQNAVHVAFVRYSDQPSVIFNLTTYYDKASIQSAVSGVQYVGGGSNLAAALNTVRTQVLASPYVRQSVTYKAVITVTDQLPAINVNGLDMSISNVRAAGIRMYGVGITSVNGRNVDTNSLYQLSYNADQVTPWQATFVYGYNDLPNKIDQVVAFACVGGTIAAVTATTPFTTTLTSTTTVTPTTPTTTLSTALFPTNVCSTTNMEMVFVVDSSSKSDSSAWPSMLMFVNSVIDLFSIGQNAVHVAFVRYSDHPSIIFNLTTYYDKASIESAVSRVQYVGGVSNLAAALDSARTQVLSSSAVRQNTLKVIIVVTDQLLAINVNGLETAINNVRAAGIRMYGVGIAYVSGRTLDSNSLYQLSLNADQSNPWQATFVYGYSDLMKKANQTAGYACVWGSIGTAVMTNTTTTTATTQSTSPTTTTSSTITRATTLPMTSGCTATNMEMVFVVDSSSKSDSSAWPSMLSFVNSVIDKFTVSQNAVHVAFVRYSDQPSVIFNLNTYYDKGLIQSAVSGVQYVGGGSNLSAALDTVRTEVLASYLVRQNALKSIVVLTDQLSAITVNGLETAINNVRQAGIRMYGVGVTYVNGRSLDSNSLYQLSFNNGQSNPWQATFVYGYSDFPNKVSQLVQFACVV